jgi:hypothetical protein
MAALSRVERDALAELRKGGLIQRDSLERLVKKNLVRANPLELTEAGRVVCALLQEIEALQREDDATTRGSY